MNLTEIYSITLGRYGDKYMVTGTFPNGTELKRVRTPKTKIDAVRLPERISIQYFGQPATTKTKNKKQTNPE